MAMSQEQRMRRALGFDLAQAAIREGAIPLATANSAAAPGNRGNALPLVPIKGPHG